MSCHSISALVRLGGWLLLTCLVLSGLYAPAGLASVCRVTTAGTAGGSGTWAAPMDLQSALGNTACSEIWVKDGTYKPTTGTDRMVSFTLDRQVAVYGGFVGSETTQAQRDPAAHVSILSGDIGIASDASDNSYHVVYIVGDENNNIGNATILDGFTITDGNANAGSLPDFSGGGLLCLGEHAGGQCNPTLRQLRFVNNHASTYGGGIELYCWVDAASSPAMSDVQFINNSAGSSGGGMDRSSQCQAMFMLERATFDGNSAGDGGGMSLGTSNGVTLRDVSFIGNSASNEGGAMNNFSLDNIILDRVNFDGNSAGALGGAMYNLSSASGHTSVIDISNTTFNNNSALASGGHGQGGAMHNEAFGGGINLVMDTVTLSNNQADFAGAIHNTDSYVGGNLSATLGNVTFSNNSATTSGRDMSTSANYVPVSVVLRNVTIHSGSTGYYALINTSSGGGAVSLGLSNVILWDPTPSLPIINSGSASVTQIDHSIVVRSNGSGSSWTTSLGTDGGGNLDADPLLGALASNGGATQTMLPAAGSPAVDAGKAVTCAAVPVDNRDQRGGPRPHGPQCDIGAIEVGAVSETIFANGFE
ncbi:MAG: choice-of-anchor Q domain-containing protein [Rhodanobacteraceae bacterium]